MSEPEVPVTVASPSKPEGSVHVHVFGRTDVGRVREHNEDSFIVADLTRNSRSLREDERVQVVGNRGTLMAVCDGMGGAAAGEVASDLAINIIFEKLLEGEPPEDHNDLARRMVRAIEAAGISIYTKAKLDRRQRGMGTTATVATLMDSQLFLGQVGDSRAYILRKHRLVQVTRDQSLVNQLIEAGQLTEQEAEVFEHNNIILQALGTAETVQVDLTYVPLCRGDVLLICSDGLSGLVRADEIRQTLLDNPDIVEACKVLTNKANEAGGHDNVTVIVARFDGDCLREPSDENPPCYAKYLLPGGMGSAPTVPGRRIPIKSSSDVQIPQEIGDRLSEHDSIHPKPGAAIPAEASPYHNTDDSSECGTEQGEADEDDDTPLWILAVLVIAVFGCLVLVAAYFAFP